MHKLKQSPEDFIVKEISNIKIQNLGSYAICILKKTNYNTIRALEQIAKVLNKNLRDFGFAGAKDKKAVTEQFISIKNIKQWEIEKIKLRDIELTFLGFADTPISLGDLIENKFTITVRNLTKKEMSKTPRPKCRVFLSTSETAPLLRTEVGRLRVAVSDVSRLEQKTKKKCIMPNYFGEQRFSKANAKIGEELVKPDFKKALSFILRTNPDNKEEIKKFIQKNPKDFIGALRLIPKKLLILYVHAYQSNLWNKTLEEYIKKIKKSPKNVKIPVIGFGTEIKDKITKKIITKIMKKESICFRSFINHSIPEISSEGSLREAFTEIKDLKILERGKDWVKLVFRLKKGSYATVAIDFLLRQSP